MALHLPDELIELIVKWLVKSPHTIRRPITHTLACLSRVSKQYNRVVEPYLYQHVHSSKKGGHTRLIGTLVMRRGLGKYARSLEAQRSPLTDWMQLPTQFHELLAAEWGDHRSEAWFRGCFWYISMLAPNLESLDVSAAKHASVDRPWLALMRPEYGHCFTNLRRVGADIRGVPIAELWPVFRLPCIETLDFVGGELCMPVGSAIRLNYHDMWNGLQSTVKDLSFTHAIPPPDLLSLRYIAESSTVLESLKFVGAKNHGFGANLFRSIIRTFGDNIIDPQFRRLEMWDERATRTDKHGSFMFRTAMREIFLQTKLTELHVDWSVIRCLWFSTHNFLLLPCELRALHMRSTLDHCDEVMTPFLLTIEDLYANIADGHYPELEIVTGELQAQDLISPSRLLDLQLRYAAENRGLCFHRKKNCAWNFERLLDEVFILMGERR